MLVTPVGQRLQKSHDGIHALVIQRRRGCQFRQGDILGHLGRIPCLARFRIDLTAGFLALIFYIEQHHCAQVLEHAIVHIGASHGDVAQRRHLELAALGGITGDCRILRQTQIDSIRLRAVQSPDGCIGGNTDVEIFVVGEEAVFQTLGATDFMAGIAIGELRRRNQNAAQLLLIGQLFFAAQEAVIFGIEGGKLVRTLESRQRLGHRGIGGVVALEHILTELRAEGREVIRVLFQPFNDSRLVRHAHFDGVERWPARLILEQEARPSQNCPPTYSPAAFLPKGGVNFA